MEELKSRLTKMLEDCSRPNCPLTEAIKYTLSHWGGLTVFLTDGRVEVDTNTVERSMRPIGMGRQNSLFSGSEGGAESWAILLRCSTRQSSMGSIRRPILRRAGAHRVRPAPRTISSTSCLAWNWKAAHEAVGQVGRMSALRRRSAHHSDDGG